jgi:hypothetical protein
LRLFEKKRKEKTLSNTNWKNPTNPESKIAWKKERPTYLAHKAEHVINLDSGIVLKAEEVSDDKQAPASIEDRLHQT